MLLKILILLPVVCVIAYIIWSFYKTRKIFSRGETATGTVIRLEKVERLGDTALKRKHRQDAYVIVEFKAYDGEMVTGKSVYTALGRFKPELGEKVALKYLSQDRKKVLLLNNYKSYSFFLQLIFAAIMLAIAIWFVFFQLDF